MARSRRSTAGKKFSRGGMTTSQIREKLQALGDHVLIAAKEALKEGVDAVVADAKQRAPVYEGHLKENGKRYLQADVTAGALRDSIKAEPNKDGTSYTLSANAQAADGTYYGQYVEFDPRINKPFLYPAMDANRAQIKENIQDAIREAIKRGG